MTYAGLVKRVKSHFENCNNGPEETPVQGDCSYILTPRARPSPAGPECKKFFIISQTMISSRPSDENVSVTHVIIGSDYRLLPARWQSIFGTNASLLLLDHSE